MPKFSIITNHEYATTSKTLIEDLVQPSLEVEVAIRNLECSTQKTLVGRNLLSLSHLFAKRTHGQKPLMDYS